MLVVAGPPGSGKSVHFPVASLGEDGFNVDLRAAAANHGSFVGIPRAVRRTVQLECERFIQEHIARRASFAVETTLRTSIAISQAESARQAGFDTAMIFVCAGSADECVHRVRIRGLAGGHSAPEAEIRTIYAASLANLGRAVRAFALVEIYDNSVRGVAPRLVARASAGIAAIVADPAPDWLPSALTSASR
jgi:predicted ABC-type ATPase